MGRSTTIVDVAHAAGVSKSTVSNVVRGAEPVSDETRRRVQAVIERLNYKPNGWSDSVGPRDREGGRLAAAHLLELGHRRIAYVRTSSAEAGGDRARQAGYAAALRAAGVEPLAPIAWEPGAAVPAELRAAGAPTAVLVWNDHRAVALIDACEAAGIPVPGALSVVGFDDIDVARLRRISLTTVAQPLDLQAGKAVTMLLDRIDAGPSGRPRHVSVPVELRVRASTGPVPASAGR